MDIFSLLSYINKVSLLAFLVTTAVVGYQIYVIRKEKSKEQKPIIPDFRDMAKTGQVANYTQLPNRLMEKETKKANYSNLIFGTISMLTVIVVIFIIFLIRRNSSQPTQITTTGTNPNQNKPVALNNVSPTPKLSITPALQLSPTLNPSPTAILSPTISLTPTLMPTGRISITPTTTLMPSPTEIILANPSPTVTIVPPTATGTPVLSKIQSLPVTGSISKGLVLFGTAITTIILSFWL